MKRILVLRPEPGGRATVERVRERGLEAISIPLFEVEPVEWDVPDAASFDGLLLTSANAVRSAGDGLKDLRGLRTYVVGAATAQAAREAGFDIASTGEAGVDRLLSSLEPDLKLLHLCGEDRRPPSKVRQEIRALTVYRSNPRQGVELKNVANCVALIHSPRAGTRFAELAGATDKSSIAVAAISGEALEAAGGGWADAEAAEAPNDDALLALAERLCKNSPPK